MLKSMTGFGAGSVKADGVTVCVELSSVNRKQLDVSLRLPSALAGREAGLQKIVKATVSRGRVSGNVQVDFAGGHTDQVVDVDKATAAVRQLRVVAKRLHLADDLGVAALLRVPGIFQSESAQLDADELSQPLECALRDALESLDAMRAVEGKALEADFQARLETLESILSGIAERAPAVVSDYRKKLFHGLETAFADAPAEMAVLAQDERVIKEIALFGEKADISEELTRLRSHIQQFRTLMFSPEPAGRPLDFLAQELFREINTIGSKANDLVITEQVVAFKTELERIREQVQNVE